ncbi:MAG TPA: DoxX family protein [Oligoflexus sp.]|uniref:DoxX family protein n=1 Tax=Oligoflexus sp. TaxID=1971216 RepID=UPI002D542DE4|nr:DoxX family protein [Oligoflexus sp.]HYX36074.1 DoxX family protein [Oligoflexus sp.]
MVRKVLLYLLALFMIGGGLTHFIMPEFYLRMTPPYIPYPELMVSLSGLLEILLGLALLIPQTRSMAAWGIIMLLIAVFPANVYMYTHSEQWPEIPPVATLIRLPLQFVFIAWAWLFTRKSAPLLRFKG